MAALIFMVQIDAQADVACNSSTQYERDGRCCEKCPPGHFALSWCHGASPTRCEVCRPGTFSADFDIARACGPCKRCNTGLRQVVLESCLPTRDTRCGCENGTHEVRLANGGFMFWCCANCPAGQEVREECDIPDFKTTCAPCPAGSFSNGSGSPCVNHTRCGAVASPPTDTSDSVCVDPTDGSEDNCAIIAATAVTIVLISLMVGVLIRLRIKHQASRTEERRESSLERECMRNGLTRNGTLHNHQSSQFPLEDDAEGGAERGDFVAQYEGTKVRGNEDKANGPWAVADDIAGYGGDVHEMRSMQRATEPDDHDDDDASKPASVGECDLGGRTKSRVKFVRRLEPGKWNKVRLCHCLDNDDPAP